jgi:hypothetical protein
MKYWNKDRDVRRVHWIPVAAPNVYSQDEAKRWCQLQESKGRFYFHYTNTRWWFEHERDAVHFAMKWSHK